MQASRLLTPIVIVLCLQLPILANDQFQPAMVAKVQSLCASGSFDAALKALNELIARFPQNIKLHLMKASLLRSMGLMSGASEEYKRVKALDPSSVEALVALSELSRQNLELGPSLDYARQAVNQAPASHAAIAALVSALLSNDRLWQAQQQIAQSLSRQPDDPQMLFLSYQADRKQGNYQQARLSLERALRLKPAESAWFAELADLLETMGEHVNAQHCYQQALKLDPASVDLKIRLARSLEYYMQDYGAALKRYQEALQSDPDCVEAEAGIDRCLQKKNDLAGQFRLFFRSMFSVTGVAAANQTDFVKTLLGP